MNIEAENNDKPDVSIKNETTLVGPDLFEILRKLDIAEQKILSYERKLANSKAINRILRSQMCSLRSQLKQIRIKNRAQRNGVLPKKSKIQIAREVLTENWTFSTAMLDIMLDKKRKSSKNWSTSDYQLGMSMCLSLN